jgi:cysteinyl-tRNA synthetase
MDLKLYDTLSREKRVFTSIDPARVRMYVCGPTVYDYAHIGNARPVIVFDVLFRLLRHLYGAEHVTYVRNITDVDDKINARAAEEYPKLPLNEGIREVTNKTDKQFHDDVAALGCLVPTVEPRATEHIEEMRTLIERLVESKNAYVEQEHVLFSVPSMPNYGKLSKRPLEEMIAGARVDVAAYKKNEMDFVLWKPSKPGEPAWPSPAGIKTPGRPGWHIECSAMSWKHLGETFDIHGGGIDLVFPHHENEIAQSRCAFHTPVMANFWMHNGFLQVEGAKMSKSLGNFVKIRDLLENWNGIGWPGEALRLNMLRTHYRQPIDWTEEGLNESHKTLWDWYSGFEGLQSGSSYSEDALECLCDDLNTPKLLAGLHELRRKRSFQTLRDTLSLLGFSGKKEDIGRKIHASAHLSASGTLVSDAILQKGQLPPLPDTSSWDTAAQIAVDQRRRQVTAITVQDTPLPLLTERVEQLIAKRAEARKVKDFKESDRIRAELETMRIELEDHKDGRTTWKSKR